MLPFLRNLMKCSNCLRPTKHLTFGYKSIWCGVTLQRIRLYCLPIARRITHIVFCAYDRRWSVDFSSYFHEKKMFKKNSVSSFFLVYIGKIVISPQYTKNVQIYTKIAQNIYDFGLNDTSSILTLEESSQIHNNFGLDSYCLAWTKKIKTLKFYWLYQD